MRVVITGSTGYLGYFIVRSLFCDHVLDCWMRPEHHPGAEALLRVDHPNVRFRVVDLADVNRVREGLEGVDAIIHLAYAHVPGRYREGHGDDLEGWYRRNIDMHLNLVLGASSQGVGRFIFMSSRAVYGDSNAWCSEDDRLSPDSHYGALKAASELLIGPFDGMLHCAVRCTGVYGCVEPVEASKWFSLLQELQATRVLVHDRVGTEVHGVDLARVVSQLLATPAPWPPAVNVCDLAVSHAQIADALARRAGFPIRVLERLEPPGRFMACEWLDGSGFHFGGRRLLEETLGSLIDAAVRPPIDLRGEAWI